MSHVISIGNFYSVISIGSPCFHGDPDGFSKKNLSIEMGHIY